MSLVIMIMYIMKILNLRWYEMDIHYTKKLRILNIRNFLCVVDTCYTCTHGIYELQKLRIFHIVNLLLFLQFS